MHILIKKYILSKDFHFNPTLQDMQSRYRMRILLYYDMTKVARDKIGKINTNLILCDKNLIPDHHHSSSPSIIFPLFNAPKSK